MLFTTAIARVAISSLFISKICPFFDDGTYFKDLYLFYACVLILSYILTILSQYYYKISD